MKFMVLPTFFYALFCPAQPWKSKKAPVVKVAIEHHIRGVENARIVALHLHQHDHVDLLARELVAGFLQDGSMKVVGPSQLEAMATELEIDPAAKLTRGQAAALAGGLGPGSVLVDLQILKLNTTTIKKGTFPKLSFFTLLDFKARVQATILKTGQRLEPFLLEVLHEAPGKVFAKEGESLPNHLLEAAFASVYREVSALFVPTVQRLELVLFQDKALGMKEAAKVYLEGDPDGALDMSLEALAAAEQSGVDNPHLGKLYFNVGCLLLALKDYPKAPAYLEKSLDLMPNAVGYNAMVAVKNQVRFADREPMRIQSEGDILLNRLRRLKKWYKEELLDKEEYRKERLSVLKPADFGTETTLPEKLAKAKALFEEKLISEQEYKVMKKGILEVTSY